MAITFFCATFLLADNCLAADSKTSSNQRLSTGWEYDDNVFEDPGNRIGNGSAVASFFTGTRSRHTSYITDFNFQAGYKAYHKLSDSRENSLVAGDIMTGKADFHVVRFFGSAWSLSGDFDLKWRGVYRKNSLNLLDEEGYVRGWAKVGAARTLENGRAQAFLGYRAAFYDYETFASFNNDSHSGVARYSRRLTRRLGGAAEYAFSRRNYERNIASPDKDGKIVERDESQRDNIHRLDLSVSYAGSQVFNLIYSLQRNDSNNYGFSYWNSRFSLVYGRLLPWNIYLNSYVFLEFKRYSDETILPIMVDLITEENDNNGAVIKLSRPLTRTFDIYLNYSYYSNESSTRNLDFHKNIAGLGITCRF